MASRIIAFGALALACIIAAGGGAYLAVRQSERAAQPVQAISQPVGAVPVSATAPPPAGLVTTPPAAGDMAGSPVAPPETATSAGAAADGASDTRSAHPAGTERGVGRPARKGADQKGQQATDKPDTGNSGTNSPVNGDGAAQPPAPPPQSVTQPAPEPQREWMEVTVPAESVLGLQVQTAISSETARVEDRVEARVTRDLRVDERVAIPAGSQALGSVVQVERGGKVKERAHFAIRFNTLILPDGTRLSLVAEAVHREGPSPANKSAAKIGGATVGGAILGAILGGGKGAAIGGAIGAGGGTAATMAGDREPATLPAGSIVNVRLMSPVTVTLER
jgi:Bacterial conjugation TrbI-like protein